MTMLAAPDRYEAAEIMVTLPSLCWSREHSEFYAVTSRVSLDGIWFRSATVPRTGDRLTCSIRHIGALDVRVVRVGVNTFTARPVAGRRRCVALARGLADAGRRQEEGLERLRAHLRIVPQRTDLQVTLEDGSVLSGRLVDVSASGAAVHLGFAVEVGARLRLGSTEAVVVRRYGNGIGASFLVPFDPAAVDEDIVL